MMTLLKNEANELVFSRTETAKNLNEVFAQTLFNSNWCSPNRQFKFRADDWIRTSMVLLTRQTPFSVEPRRQGVWHVEKVKRALVRKNYAMKHL